MANKTQLRLTQMTGSYGTSAGQINDATAAAATTAQDNADLSSVLSHMAASIKRINGASTFSEAAAGVFGQAILPDSSGGQNIGSTSAEWGHIFIADDKKLQFGSDQDVTIEYDEDGADVLQIAGGHVRIGHGTTTQLQFRDAAIHIASADDGVLDLTADTRIDLNSDVTIKGTTPTLTIGDGGDEDTSLVFDQSGQDFYIGVDATDDDLKFGLGSAVGTNTALTLDGDANLTAAGRVIIDDNTEATTTTDGSLQTDGGLSVVKSAVIGDDLDLLSDSAILSLGAGKDVTLTHDGGTGATLASAGAFLIDGANTVSIDGASGVNIGTNDNGAAISIGHTTSEVTVNDNLTVTGDLTVNGTTVTLDTTNLNVQDPFIFANDGAQSLNSNTGIVFASGSNVSARPDVVLGRISTNTFGFGTIAGSSGSLTNATSMTTTDLAFRTGKYEIGTGTNYIELDTDVKIIAAADITLDPGGNDVRVDGNVVPNSDSADSLGASGTAWANLYVDAIDLNGQGSISVGGTGRIDLDADDDTSIRASADDVISFEIGGSDLFTMRAEGLTVVDDVGIVFGTDFDISIKYDEAGNDALTIDGDVLIEDNKGLFFGNNKDAEFKYDEAGVDALVYEGASMRFADDTKLEFGQAGDFSMEYDEDGNDVMLLAGASVRFSDDQKLEFGATGDASIEYDENGDDVVQVAGSSWRFFHGATGQIQFRDSGIAIGTSTDGQLALDADGFVEFGSPYLQVGNGTTNEGRIRLMEDETNGTNYVLLAARDNLGSNVNFILPAGNGSNGQVLTTDGTGVLSYQDMTSAGSAVKTYATLQGAVAANANLSSDGGYSVTDYSAISTANASKVIDVYVNGQLLQSGSGPYTTDTSAGGFTSGDYLAKTLTMNQLDIKFAFALEADDVVCIIGRA